MPEAIQPAGDFANWPSLRFTYRTDPDCIAPLLPPGITPGAEPHVYINVYQVPIGGEPEFGVTVKVPADYAGEHGFYSLGLGIDQEQAIFISRELNGQPKFPCSIKYYRIGSTVSTRCWHQGYTFLEFTGEMGADVTAAGAPETSETEWWIKSLRAVNWAEKQYDYPPHVVRVASTSRLVYRFDVNGDLILRESPWDPIATLLPMREQLAVHLQLTAMDFASRSLTIAGELDPDAFWPMADTIGGSRWPGMMGGPRRSS